MEKSRVEREARLEAFRKAGRLIALLREKHLSRQSG